MRIFSARLAVFRTGVPGFNALDFSGNLNRLKEVVSSYSESEQKRVKVVHHDLKAELNPEISATIGKIDYISHLAAGSHVDRSITFPNISLNQIGYCLAAQRDVFRPGLVIL